MKSELKLRKYIEHPPVERRGVSARALLALGASGPGGAAGDPPEPALWQRVRGPREMRPRWAKRYLLLAHNLLYAFRSLEVSTPTTDWLYSEM